MSRASRSEPVRRAVVLLGVIALVYVTLAGDRQPLMKSVREPAVVAAAAVPNPTTTSGRPAPVPEIEALIPLSTDAIRDEVSQSVGFVLSQQGTGSGVVISDDLLVTNAHVVWPDPSVTVVFQNGSIHHGTVLAVDPFVDLALVDISRLTRKPHPITLGSTADLVIGDELYVLGYPSPDEFTPLATVDAGQLRGFSDWEFTSVGWFTIEAPAIGGQSGGAIVDEYGRLVGVSTFGSTSSLTSIAVDDVVEAVDRLVASPRVRGLEPRDLPRNRAQRTIEIDLADSWDQQLLLGWFLPDSELTVEWTGGDGVLSASSISGDVLGTARGSLTFVTEFAFPVVVTAESDHASGGVVDSSLPLVPYTDPDHGRTLAAVGTSFGIYEVGGDRDFFYLELEAGERVSITVESAARTHLTIYSPDSELTVEDRDMAGFIDGNAAVSFTAGETGRFVVAVESNLATVSGYAIVTRVEPGTSG